MCATEYESLGIHWVCSSTASCLLPINTSTGTIALALAFFSCHPFSLFAKSHEISQHRYSHFCCLPLIICVYAFCDADGFWSRVLKSMQFHLMKRPGSFFCNSKLPNLQGHASVCFSQSWTSSQPWLIHTEVSRKNCTEMSYVFAPSNISFFVARFPLKWNLSKP